MMMGLNRLLLNLKVHALLSFLHDVMVTCPRSSCYPVLDCFQYAKNGAENLVYFIVSDAKTEAKGWGGGLQGILRPFWFS